MKSCTACENSSTCSSLCDQAAAAIRPSWSTSLRELSLGSLIEIIPSSQAYEPVNSEFPYFEPLKPMENKILEAFYCDGLKISAIAKKYRRKKNTVKSILKRSRGKIATVPLFIEDNKR